MKRILFFFFAISFSYSQVSASEKYSDNILVVQQAQTTIGKWRVKIALGNGKYQTVVLHIYSKGGKYYANGIAGLEELTRKGNTFFVNGSSYGDYYNINNGHLTIGDQDGPIKSYVTVKIQ